MGFIPHSATGGQRETYVSLSLSLPLSFLNRLSINHSSWPPGNAWSAWTGSRRANCEQVQAKVQDIYAHRHIFIGYILYETNNYRCTILETLHTRFGGQEAQGLFKEGSSSSADDEAGTNVTTRLECGKRRRARGQECRGQESGVRDGNCVEYKLYSSVLKSLGSTRAQELPSQPGRNNLIISCTDPDLSIWPSSCALLPLLP